MDLPTSKQIRSKTTSIFLLVQKERSSSGRVRNCFPAPFSFPSAAPPLSASRIWSSASRGSMLSCVPEFNFCMFSHSRKVCENLRGPKKESSCSAFSPDLQKFPEFFSRRVAATNPCHLTEVWQQETPITDRRATRFSGRRVCHQWAREQESGGSNPQGVLHTNDPLKKLLSISSWVCVWVHLYVLFTQRLPKKKNISDWTLWLFYFQNIKKSLLVCCWIWATFILVVSFRPCRATSRSQSAERGDQCGSMGPKLSAWSVLLPPQPFGCFCPFRCLLRFNWSGSPRARRDVFPQLLRVCGQAKLKARANAREVLVQFIYLQNYYSCLYTVLVERNSFYLNY